MKQKVNLDLDFSPLRLIDKTQTHTNTPGTTLLNERSSHGKGRYTHNTQYPFPLSLSPVALRPISGNDLLILGGSRSHTTTHHSRYDSSGRVISSSQGPLPDNTQHPYQTPMPPGGFEPKSQQASGCRPTS